MTCFIAEAEVYEEFHKSTQLIEYQNLMLSIKLFFFFVMRLLIRVLSGDGLCYYAFELLESFFKEILRATLR